MPDRHDRKPISFRPRKEIEPWLDAYAKKTGQSHALVLAEALDLLRQQAEHAPTVAGIRIITDERMPAGVAALAAADHDGKPQVAALRTAPEVNCPHPKSRVHKGLCHACGQPVT